MGDESARFRRSTPSQSAVFRTVKRSARTENRSRSLIRSVTGRALNEMPTIAQLALVIEEIIIEEIAQLDDHDAREEVARASVLE